MSVADSRSRTTSSRGQSGEGVSDVRVPALHDLFPEAEGRLRAICFQLLSCPQDVEDALQETAVQYLTHAHTIREPSAALAWLMTTARHAAYAILRRRSRQSAGHPHATPPQPSEEPGTQLMLRESNIGVRQALRTLPNHYQAALQLRYVDGLSHAEAALCMDLTGVQYRGVLQRAKVALRGVLTNKCSDFL